MRQFQNNFSHKKCIVIERLGLLIKITNITLMAPRQHVIFLLKHRFNLLCGVQELLSPVHVCWVSVLSAEVLCDLSCGELCFAHISKISCKVDCFSFNQRTQQSHICCFSSSSWKRKTDSIKLTSQHFSTVFGLCPEYSWVNRKYKAYMKLIYLLKTPPSNEALRHSGGDNLRWTSAIVTLYFDVDDKRDNLPGVEQKISIGNLELICLSDWCPWP